MENLSTSLKNSLSKIARSIFVDKDLIEDLIKDIQRALLQADVDVKLVFEISNKIKERALKEKPPSGVNQKEYLIKIVYEELVKFLGEEKSEIKIEKKPFNIMMVGLYGNGKTTTISKIAKYYSKKGLKIATLGLDVHRAQAPQQLEQVSKDAGVKCFINPKEKSPLKIYKEFEKEFNKYDIIIIDTAGRDSLSKDLIKEIKDLNNKIKPNEVLLVIGADIGQAAKEQAEKFHESCGITGVIITKMDGTAKAGGALAATATTKAHVKFIGTGEKVSDLELFNPKGFVSRLLGMGDLEALLEKAKEAISEEKAEDLGKRFLKGDFNFLDLYEQMHAMKKMGPLSKVVDMIPGFGGLNLPKEMLQVQEDKLKTWKYIMQSLTKKELENPEILDRNRIERIARGSGVTVKEVRELLKQYKQSKKLIKIIKGKGEVKNINKLMKKFKGKMPKGLKI